MQHLKSIIENYIPKCEQEEKDREAMLAFMEIHSDCLTRNSRAAHFTASSWIVNRERTKVLMIYHNIYDSWSWTGGHADGDADLLGVAIKEAKEETGIRTITPVSEEPVSLEIITVDGHIKRGAYVSSHVHLNLTYLMEADEEEALRIKEDENSGVRWIETKDLAEYVSEPWMLNRIYHKLCGLL